MVYDGRAATITPADAERELQMGCVRCNIQTGLEIVVHGGRGEVFHETFASSFLAGGILASSLEDTGATHAEQVCIADLPLSSHEFACLCTCLRGGGGIGVAAHAIEPFDGSEVIGVYDALEARAPHDTSQGTPTRAPGFHCTGLCPFLGLCKGSFAPMTTE